MNDHSQRNYGIDMLRCLAMFCVIFQHILGQGKILEYAQAIPAKYFFLSYFDILSRCTVNVYGITTGYLMCRKSFKLSRITTLWCTTLFWSLSVSWALFLIYPPARTFEELISMFLPILRGRYWFFTAYFVVMLLSPILNLLIRSLSLSQFRLLLAVLLLIFGIIPVGALGNDVMRISGGNHFSWMIALYLMGGYLRIHEEKQNPLQSTPPGKLFLGFWAIGALNLAYQLLVHLIGFSQYAQLLMDSVSPLIVAESFCIFLCFRRLGARICPNGSAAQFLDFAAPGVYSVYVIHVHPKLFWNQALIALLRPWDTLPGPAILAAAWAASGAVFAICILLDFLRQKLFSLLGFHTSIEKISQSIEFTLRRYLS